MDRITMKERAKTVDLLTQLLAKYGMADILILLGEAQQERDIYEEDETLRTGRGIIL